jgi:hypothetical protein
MSFRRRALLVVGLTLWGTPAAVQAAPTLITSRPVSDPATRDFSFFVGGVDDGGRSLKGDGIEPLLDGQPTEPSGSPVGLADWAATSSEASATWRPPLSVGLVYLWIDGVPSGLLEGLHSFFQRVPSRTTVYPTIYGRLRQGRAHLAAADIGRLDELPYLDAYRPNLIDAVGMNLSDLAADESLLKVLLIVTDGRDFADPKGEAPGDFAALGQRLHEAGITPLVVGFPPREQSDASQAAANLRDLHDAAGGFLRVLDQADDLENTLESLGQALADLRRVQVAAPLGWRLFGGTHRVSVRLAARGERLSANIGTITAPAGAGPWLIAGLVVVLVGALGGVALVRARSSKKRRADRGGDEDDGGDEGDGGDEDEDVEAEAVVSAAHDLIRRGASPARAVQELTRQRGAAVRVLVDLDPEILNDPRFPYFRTRPGRLRIKEIQNLLSKKAASRPAVGATLAGILAEAIKQGMPADQAAETLAARLPSDETTAFASLKLDELAQALREAAHREAALGTPRARGIAVAIQDALRVDGGAARGVAVGWLVRAGGPGRRGETLRLTPPRVVIGQGTRSTLRIVGDARLADEHAEISILGGEFVVAPLGGALSVEGKPVLGKRTLSDGETIELGGGLYVFKAARAGSLPLTEARSGSRSR